MAIQNLSIKNASGTAQSFQVVNPAGGLDQWARWRLSIPGVNLVSLLPKVQFKCAYTQKSGMTRLTETVVVPPRPVGTQTDASVAGKRPYVKTTTYSIPDDFPLDQIPDAQAYAVNTAAEPYIVGLLTARVGAY